MDSKEALMKMLDDHSETGLHLKQAWKVGDMQETQNFMVSDLSFQLVNVVTTLFVFKW